MLLSQFFAIFKVARVGLSWVAAGICYCQCSPNGSYRNGVCRALWTVATPFYLITMSWGMAILGNVMSRHVYQIHFSVSSPLQSWSKAVVCISTPRNDIPVTRVLPSFFINNIFGRNVFNTSFLITGTRSEMSVYWPVCSSELKQPWHHY